MLHQPKSFIRRRGLLARTARAVLRLRRVGLYGLLLALTPVFGTTALVALEAGYGWSEYLEGEVWLAVVLILIAGALGVGLAMVVTHAVSLTCGWALGFWLGLPVALVAWTLAACINYGLGYLLAGDEMEHFIRRRRKLRQLHKLFLKVDAKREATLVFLLRVSPVLPFTTTNVMLASAKVPIRPYALGTFLGKAPQGAAVVFLGTQMQTFSLERPSEAWLTWLVVVLTVGAVLAASWIGKRALRRISEGEE